MQTATINTMTTIAELKQMTEGQNASFQSVVLLRKVAVRPTRNGSTFLAVEVGDRSGSMSFNCFDNAAYFAQLRDLAVASVMHIEGRVDFYQGQLSPRVTHVRTLTSHEVEEGDWMARLIESSPEDNRVLWDEFQGFIVAIEHEALRATTMRTIEELGEAFRISPAAISMHHAYRYGLLEHTVHMARAAKALLPLYPEVHPDLAMTGILLHDVGKAVEYNSDLVTSKTDIGLLQGHVILGYRSVRKAALQCNLAPELTDRLEHIILSHQGELEWGAAVMAATPEAVFVSMIDNLDAKMGMVQHALRQTSKSDAFSPYLPGLKTSVMVAPVPNC